MMSETSNSLNLKFNASNMNLTSGAQALVYCMLNCTSWQDDRHRAHIKFTIPLLGKSSCLIYISN